MSMLGSVTQLTGTNVEAQRQESFALLGQISTFSRDGVTDGAVCVLPRKR